MYTVFTLFVSIISLVSASRRSLPYRGIQSALFIDTSSFP